MEAKSCSTISIWISSQRLLRCSKFPVSLMSSKLREVKLSANSKEWPATSTSPNSTRRPYLESSDFIECISLLNTNLARNLQVCLEFKDLNYN